MLPHTPYQPPCHITWQGMVIEVRYTPMWFDMPGYQIAHLEVCTLAPADHPLPFADTGYRSTFLPVGPIEAYGGPSRYVRDWLDQAASSLAWQEKMAAERQLTLF